MLLRLYKRLDRNVAIGANARQRGAISAARGEIGRREETEQRTAEKSARAVRLERVPAQHAARRIGAHRDAQRRRAKEEAGAARRLGPPLGILVGVGPEKIAEQTFTWILLWILIILDFWLECQFQEENS